MNNIQIAQNNSTPPKSYQALNTKTLLQETNA